MLAGCWAWLGAGHGVRAWPECVVSLNSRKQIMGEASVRDVRRAPVLETEKITSGSSTIDSRWQKKDARQLDTDQMSLVAPE